MEEVREIAEAARLRDKMTEKSIDGPLKIGVFGGWWLHDTKVFVMFSY